MAHSCPDCGALCHCGGDIDDIDFGDETAEATACRHCDCPKCGSPLEMCGCYPREYDDEPEMTHADHEAELMDRLKYPRNPKHSPKGWNG